MLSDSGPLAHYVATGELRYAILAELREVYAAKPLSIDQRASVRDLAVSLAGYLWEADAKIDEALRHS